MPRVLAISATLHAGTDANSEVLAQLAAGDVVEVLELSGGRAWGVAPGRGLVGYVDATALKSAPQS